MTRPTTPTILDFHGNTRAGKTPAVLATVSTAAGPVRRGPFATAGLLPSILAAAILLSGLIAGPAQAQVCGDVNADDEVTAGDAQRVLRAAVGQPVDLVCTDQCAALEGRLAVLEALLANLTVDGDNLVLSGKNFQVVSGEGETDGDVNGTGNIIIGYNESNNTQDEKSGSHNLIIGMNHSYSDYGGIVAGEDNEISGTSAAVLGGTRNSAEGDNSVIVAGEINRTFSRNCAIASGTLNSCEGVSGAVSGGINNTCNGNAAVLSGGSNRILDTNGAWLAGQLFQPQ